jgi:restriction endonuclease Mrr
VVNGDPAASKGVLVTTSRFAPRIMMETAIANAVPTRLELIDGEHLQRLLAEASSG